MPYLNKFNMEIGTLVAEMNGKYRDRLVWHFMGMPAPVADRIAHFPNVVLREPFAISVRDFLEETDVFLFYPTWDRLEPWARSTAEALMSGSPVVATARGGNCDQVVHGNNGFLCQSREDFVRFLSVMIDQPDLVQAFGQNAFLYSTYFRTEYVIQKLMRFIG
jgi:glycosyltransferase involved in cell wall biosynthesis